MEEEKMQTQEDFKNAIDKFLKQTKEKKLGGTEQVQSMKEKMDRFGGETDKLLKNMIYNKVKNMYCGRKLMQWFAKTLEI